tara:strand:- start:1046 stop:1723 length:678 start_codon:yes stop_codon:yes gene_type:complete
MSEFLKNLNQKQRLAALGGACLVFCAGLGFLIYSKLGERSGVLLALAACEAEEASLRDKIGRISGLEEQRTRLIQTTDSYAEILPAEEHVQHDAFVKVMDEYRRNTQLLIKSAEYLPPADSAAAVAAVADGEAKARNFVRHRYRFQLLGTVPDLLQFMSRIENHKRFLKIDAVSLKPLGATGEFPEGDLRERNDSELLGLARNSVKEIDLTVSTYTYLKEAESKP